MTAERFYCGTVAYAYGGRVEEARTCKCRFCAADPGARLLLRLRMPDGSEVCLRHARPESLRESLPEVRDHHTGRMVTAWKR